MNVDEISSLAKDYVPNFARSRFITINHNGNDFPMFVPSLLILCGDDFELFAKIHKSVVFTHELVEYPETRLYPTAQVELAKDIVVRRKEQPILLLTHSPYLLSKLNNFIFAYEIAQVVGFGELKKEVEPEHWLNQKHVAAYFCQNGEIRNMKSKGTNGFIMVEYIDEASENTNDQYDILSDLYWREKQKSKITNP